MNRIVKTIRAQQKKAKDRGWDRLYFLIDVHETILEPNYEGLSNEFYHKAKECLQELSGRKECVLIMWTCSKPEHCLHYLNFFLDNGIVFQYINRNPETEMNPDAHGDYTHKPYCNILLDDKAGFDPYTDWYAILEYIKEHESLV